MVVEKVLMRAGKERLRKWLAGRGWMAMGATTSVGLVKMETTGVEDIVIDTEMG